MRMADDKLSDYEADARSESSDAEETRIDLVERLDTEDLQVLRGHFFPPGDTDKMKQLKSKYALGYKYCGIPLNMEEFVKAMEVILGSTLYAESAACLFQALDAQKCGAVWWEQLLDHVIERIGQRDREPAACRPLDPRVDVHHADHCQRETIVRVVAIPGPNTFCYAVISKYGRVGVYDGRLQLRESYTLHAVSRDQGGGRLGEPGMGQGVPEGAAARRRVGRSWVTDAAYLCDARSLLALSSDRSMYVLDASSLCHTPLCHVAGMRNVPLCATYSVASAPGETSLLLVGDDRGGVASLRFQQPHTALFRKRHPDRLDKYHWADIEKQPMYVSVNVDENIHADAVRQVAYCAENDTVISCSHDPNATIVVRHLGARRSPYIFRIARGVRCFHLERSLKLLATGSSDGVVRLWNPVVTKQPAASLFGHKAAIVDVQLVRRLAAALSVSADGVVKVWDIEDHCCLQSLSLGLTLSASRTIDFGTRALYPGPPAQRDSHVADINRDSTSLEWAYDDQNGRNGKTLRVLVAYCSQLAVLRLSIPSNGLSGTAGGSGDSRATPGDMAPRHAGDACDSRRRRMTIPRARSPSPPPPPTRERPPCVPAPWRAAEDRVRLTPDGASSVFSDQESSPLSSPLLERMHVAVGPSVAMRSRPSSSMSPAAAAGSATRATNAFVGGSGGGGGGGGGGGAVPVSASVGSVPSDLNARRVAHERRAREMRWLVERCAPHLALQLHDLEEVRFNRPLPPTLRMRERNVEPSTSSATTLARALGIRGDGAGGGGGGGGGGALSTSALSPQPSSGGSSSRSSVKGAARSRRTAALPRNSVRK